MPSGYNENEQLPWEEIPRKKSPKNILIIISSIPIILTVSFVLFIVISLLWSTPTQGTVAEVVDIQQLDSYPVSNHEIKEKIMEVNYYDRLETDFSNIGYKYKVTLDNGREFILSPGNRVYDIGSPNTYLELNGYIWTNELGEIIKSSENTVEITVSAKIKGSDSRYSIISDYEQTYEKKIVDCFVKNLRNVSTDTVSSYINCDKIFIDAGEFEITYSDGRKVIAKPETSEDGSHQTLDGHYMNVWGIDDNEDGADDRVGISILDFSGDCEIKLTQLEYPFSAVELTDCTFDENYKITSLSYNVTYKDGTVKQFNNLKPIPELSRSWVLRYDDNFEMAPLHGYYVIAEPEFIYPKDSEKSKINVKLTVGFISEEQVVSNKVFDAPESDCECLCHNNGKTEKKLYTALKTIMEFLAINEYCKCGIYHYEISSF